MSSFKVMTWNVENFFRPGAQAAEEDKERFEEKLRFLADVIHQLNPDVVALQEVGGESALEDLQERLDGTHQYRAVSSFPDHRGIRVAFLSKHALDDEEDIVDFPKGPALDIHELSSTGESIPIERMGRGALRARVTRDGLSVGMIACHLKSKLLSFPRPWGTSFAPSDEGERAQVAGIALMRRMAEAVTVRIRANGLLEDDQRTPLLVLGDFNDVPEAQTSLILTGPPGSEIGTGAFEEADEGDRARLFNLAPQIPEEGRYSRIESGRKELLDQIFASVEFFPFEEGGKRRLPVVESHVELWGGLPSVGADPVEREVDVAPDHAPVTALFEL